MLSQKRKYREQVVSYLFVLPSLLFMFVFLIYPIFSSLYLSLTSYNFVYSASPKFIGLRNYLNLPYDKIFVVSLKNTVYYTAFYFPLMMFLPLCLGALLYERVKGTAFFRSCILTPMIIPLSLVSVAFIWIFSDDFGILNHILINVLKMPFLSKNWLMDRKIVIPSLVGVGFWKYAGFATVIYLAGLQSISETLYDAAKIDGANRLQIFGYITLPNLKESFILVGLLGIMQSFKVFTQAFVMTAGGPGTNSLVLYLYFWKTAFSYFEMGYAAAIAYFTAVVIFVPSVLIFLVVKTERK